MKYILLFSLLIGIPSISRCQYISVSQIEKIVDSTVDYATSFLGQNRWMYHGITKPENAPSYLIYQFLNTQNNTVRRVALFVSVKSKKIDMFLLNTPDESQYTKILNELSADKTYRIDTTIVTSSEVKKRFINTFFDHHNNENELFSMGLKVLDLSERIQSNDYKNIYSLKMEVEYRKD